jgi:hypothetical protein
MMFDRRLVDRDIDRREFAVSTLGVVEENAQAAGRFLQDPQCSLGKALGARHLGR